MMTTIEHDFLVFGWKEAIQEGLKQEYPGGGERLWNYMTTRMSRHFSGPYPDTDELRVEACKNYVTKQIREERWRRDNIPNFLKKLNRLVHLVLPLVPMRIVFEYAEPEFTWIDIE